MSVDVSYVKISLTTMNDNFTKKRKKESDLYGQVLNETLNQAIPIGFIYTQLPFKSSPQVLWKWAAWEQITALYEGHFFRAEGGNSAPFETSQLDSVQKHPILRNKYGFYARRGPGDDINDPFQGKWYKNNGDLRMSNETRPINYAVRIWQRIA